MRIIDCNIVKQKVKEIILQTNFVISEDILYCLKSSIEIEESHLSKEVLSQLIENASIAQSKRLPLCQDCGFVIILMEIGQDVHFENGFIIDSINNGIAEAYQEGYLRKSILANPLNRQSNTGTNTPAVIWTDIVEGDIFHLSISIKGGGSENMSSISMLKPSDGIEGVKNFIIDTVKKAGSNPCPPIIVGVGIGGTFEKAAFLSKKALFRGIGKRNCIEFYSNLEIELLKEINNLGIGPAGFGGKTTALDVFIETFPCHIASLPVAVNIQCNSSRHCSVFI